jgi:hypothetical protein
LVRSYSSTAVADSLEELNTSLAIVGGTIAYATIFACTWPILSHNPILSEPR